jgi:Caspase domain
MFRRMLRVCIFVAACLPALASGALAEKRVALVVGNSAYRYVPQLANPANDARLMAVTLKGLGFELVGGDAQLDLDKPSFDRAVLSFGRQIQGADVALFYYAGHGVQIRGTNYLVPVDSNLTREADVDFQMLDTILVLRQMEGSRTKLNLVVLDACRNNPFGGRGLRSSTGGLAQMRAPDGTLISFATQPGSIAIDGTDGHSPFTRALATTIRKPGLGLFDVFNDVGLRVKHVTGGEQQPWLSSSPIDGNFYFAGTLEEGPAKVSLPVAAAVAIPVAQPAHPAIDAMVRDYEFAERIGTRQAWDSFLSAHNSDPAGKYYVDLARAARDKVDAAAALHKREQEAREAETKRVEEARKKIAMTSLPAQATTSERPRQTPSISLESLAQEFLINYVNRSQASLPELLDYARSNYASEVDYYGKRNSTQQVVEDQRIYATRWPERGFRLRPASERIACNKPASSCEMSGEIDFRAANPLKGKVSIGVATFHLRVKFSSAGPKIYFENGEVISRRN